MDKTEKITCTACNECVKEDVCKFREEYMSALSTVKSLSWSSGRQTIVDFRDSDLIVIDVKCKRYRYEFPESGIKFIKSPMPTSD